METLDKRKKASEFPQGLLDLCQLYVHGEIDRNAFLAGAGQFAVGGVTSLDRDKMAEDFVAAAAWLAARPDVGRVGVVGFCYGGGVAHTVAARMPTLAAAVPFYGQAPAAADVPKIEAAAKLAWSRALTWFGTYLKSA